MLKQDIHELWTETNFQCMILEARKAWKIQSFFEIIIT